jgi:hypothetical protein
MMPVLLTVFAVLFAQWALQETRPFIERFQAHIGVHRFNAMWTFWLEPASRRLCIKRRIEWDGLLVSCGYEELFAITVADL